MDKRLTATMSKNGSEVFNHELLVEGDRLRLVKGEGYSFSERLEEYVDQYCNRWLNDDFVLPNEGDRFKAVLRRGYEMDIRGFNGNRYVHFDDLIDDRGILGGNDEIDFSKGKQNGSGSSTMSSDVWDYVNDFSEMAGISFDLSYVEYEVYLSAGNNFLSRLKIEPDGK
jgi:hypothetical protein